MSRISICNGVSERKTQRARKKAEWTARPRQKYVDVRVFDSRPIDRRGSWKTTPDGSLVASFRQWPLMAQTNAAPLLETLMRSEDILAPRAAATNEAGPKSVTAREDRGYRLLATMVQGTAAALPESWQVYPPVDDARNGAGEMLHNHRVLRVAIVTDRVPPQFVEWVGR